MVGAEAHAEAAQRGARVLVEAAHVFRNLAALDQAEILVKAEGDAACRAFDALGLAPFAPAPRFGAALNAFLAEPGAESYDGLWQVCAFDVDRMGAAMGESWDTLRAYAIELLGEPGTAAALRDLGFSPAAETS